MSETNGQNARSDWDLRFPSPQPSPPGRGSNFGVVAEQSTCGDSIQRWKGRLAFTLVELLVVIAIIGILAALLLPALAAAKKAAQVKKAKTEISQLATAIAHYDSTYSRYPTAQTNSADFTYGGMALSNVLGSPGIWTSNNDEVIAILMDLDKYPNGTPTVNAGHVKNTQQVKFLTATMTGDTVSPGVGTDLIYRDPWGNPYIISMDLNYNENTQDAFYKLQGVSQQFSNQPIGFNGLNNPSDPSGNSDDYEYHGGVMVWSLGPDKQASKAFKANSGVNKDNVLSWTP